MIKIQTVQFAFDKFGIAHEISESEITTEEACRILHSLSWHDREGATIIYTSKEDKEQLIKTYRKLYQDNFNILHKISDEEQGKLHLAYPAETDVFYAENLIFRIEAGIRRLDPNYARVNTHQTVLNFKITPIFECIAIDNAPDAEMKSEMKSLQQYVIYKYEQLNHPSYKDAQKHLKYIWSAYQEFFLDNSKFPNISRIIEVNKNFDIPWYNRL